MFMHLLVPIDGSELSEKAVYKAVSMAKDSGATVTFFHAQPDTSSSIYGETELLRTIDPQTVTRAIIRKSQVILEKAVAHAKAEGVNCDSLFSVSNSPYEAIISAAESTSADLIVMASHGHRGVKGLLLGSQTQKVLTHSTLPVLVYR